jgi:hypothetical protein
LPQERLAHHRLDGLPRLLRAHLAAGEQRGDQYRVRPSHVVVPRAASLGSARCCCPPSIIGQPPALGAAPSIMNLGPLSIMPGSPPSGIQPLQDPEPAVSLELAVFSKA